MEPALTLTQRKTVADYMRLPEGTPIQLINGEFVMSPSPIRAHQRISMQLSAQLYDFVKDNKLGEVYSAPFDVHLSAFDAFQPDILFVARERLDIIHDDGVHGAPDLVVEVLSPSTAGYDLLLKKDAYERYGVKEYWIIDPKDRTLEVFEHTGSEFNNIFSGNSGSVCSKLLPKFCVDISLLF